MPELEITRHSNSDGFKIKSIETLDHVNSASSCVIFYTCIAKADPESQKGGNEGAGPQFWKKGAGKWHLNAHFTVFLINLL